MLDPLVFFMTILLHRSVNLPYYPSPFWFAKHYNPKSYPITLNNISYRTLYTYPNLLDSYLYVLRITHQKN